MSDDGFFGDVFGSPEEDPLLDANEEPDPPEEESVPSWMQPGDDAEEETPDEGTSPASGPTTPSERSRPSSPEPTEAEDGANRRSVVLDLSTGGANALEEVNEAVSQDWRITEIAPNAQTGPPGADDRRLVVVLEREGPNSLFEFG